MGNPVVAVRSSATCEDREGASAAGQHATFLMVRGEEALLQAVRKCWASLWSSRALDYRQRRGLDQYTAKMAVIIQEMVPAEVSGVLFSRDPLQPGENCLRIEAVPGLGEALVSGSMAGDVLLVDRNTLAQTGKRSNLNVLEGSCLQELCASALRIEEEFVAPQDIEFAIADNTVFFLQTRPMTGLENALVDPVEPLGKPSRLDVMIKPFVDERYVIAPRPLDNLFVKGLLGGHLYSIRASGAVIRPEDEEAVMSQLWRQAYRLPPVHRLGYMFLRSLLVLAGQLQADWLDWWESGPGSEVMAISQLRDLSKLTDSELFERTEEILAVWKNYLNKRMFAAGAVHAEVLLRLLVTLAVGPGDSGKVMSHLMSGIESPTLNLNEDLLAPFQTGARQSKDPVRGSSGKAAAAGRHISRQRFSQGFQCVHSQIRTSRRSLLVFDDTQLAAR